MREVRYNIDDVFMNMMTMMMMMIMIMMMMIIIMIMIMEVVLSWLQTKWQEFQGGTRPYAKWPIRQRLCKHRHQSKISRDKKSLALQQILTL